MKANDFLDNLEVDYRLIEQENPTKSCDDAARERGIKVSQITKSLIIDRNQQKGNKKNSERVHALLPGDREISEKKFGEHRLVEPEVSKEITGFESGTVHPFSTNIMHIIDYRLLQKEELSFTIGRKDKGIIIKGEEFEKALDKSEFEYKVKDIVIHNQRDVENLVDNNLTCEQARFILKKGLTPLFTNLNNNNSSQKIFKVLKELERENACYTADNVKKIMESTENETHMQKVVQEFSETGNIIVDDREFELESIVENLLGENKQVKRDILDGKTSAIHYLIGEVMKKTQGRADPENTRKIIENRVE